FDAPGATCLAVAPGGDRFFTGAEDGRITEWTLATGSAATWTTGSPVRALEAVAEGARWDVASGHADGHIRYWGAERSKLVAWTDSRGAAVTRLTRSADGTKIASADAIGSISVLDIGTGTEWSLRAYLRGVRDVAAWGDEVVTCSAEGAVRLTSTRDGHTIWETPENQATSCARTRDGSTIVVGTAEGAIALFDPSGAVRSAELVGHVEGVTSVAVSEDGARLLSASGDATVRLWDLEHAQPLGAPEGHAGAVDAVAVSADGELVASGSSELRVWDAKTLASPRVMKRPEGRHVKACAFSPDGRRIAVASALSGKVELWDPKNELGDRADAL